MDAVTTGEQFLCHLCNRLHEGLGAALRCCSDRFDDSELIADGGKVEACPECGSSRFHILSTRDSTVGRYGCKDCPAKFDEPIMRPRQQPSRGPTHGLGRKLAQANSGDD